MNPGFSAQVVLSRMQRAGLIVALVLITGWAVLFPMAVLQTLVAIVTVAYGAAIVFRVVLVWASTRGEHLIRVSDEEARAVADHDLPVYTVLVPAYREPAVIGQLMSHLGALEYPADKLEIILLLEEDDRETIDAAAAVVTGGHVRILVVPESQPKTKPKACNVGLEQATGEFVTIYDAEDVPDPLQLRRAVVALRRLGPSYVCLQAELGYFNVDQNRITKWFALEYATWFRSLLPGLVALRMPIPLGGTSNHFRARELRELGAWDPYNVTEDADLGIRLARSGYRVGVLDSVTLEEANSDFINWIKQRSRWYKGYLMTWLVHLRSPRATVRQLGWRGILCLNLFVGGTPLAALLNAVLWATTILWFLDRPPIMEEIFVPPFYYLGVICLVFGNATVIYLNVLSARTMDRPDLLGTALLSPGYWAMMSLAGAKAAWQLVFKPSYWEKTTHGLHLPKEAVDVG
ncbi:glycosyltransferase family 2 protein [Actinoplanes xinjiangensis]|uniref:Cellulose synthase/poly-beta-1,6-N-acetylglucosamine synthase-like glycosyltransferase n=1 Tax=Actinoplanes xinjiangensis TaxID=512350 RepID=A0A316EKI7_9ACTN|nr:glycosyltransferase [Actinoplanes xinjiangensis]PWK31539.1 cellulose synthase/poly-beta-1,6-N-acetylglucosamine synthase-like glycosyltransferase [Actinoplanes xinjiangensis]GIF44054.1 N-acetylglucosaminyltransferase [Actinoplanes xinjiangensis]